MCIQRFEDHHEVLPKFQRKQKDLVLLGTRTYFGRGDPRQAFSSLDRSNWTSTSDTPLKH